MSEQHSSIGRIPPHNTNAEKSVLGAMILSNKAAASAIQSLEITDFYLLAHQRIFEATLALSRLGQNIDLVTLSGVLLNDGALEAVGGYSYLAEISEFVPTVSNVSQYVRIVKDCAVLRQLIEAAGKITEECFGDDKDVKDIISNAEKAIFDISQIEDAKQFVHIRKAVDDVINNIEERYNNPGAVTGIRTGFSAIDNKLGGLHPSELILLACRPGMGKTAFALNIVQQAARLDNANVAVFSLEMPYDQLAERLISSVGEIGMQSIKTGMMSESDWDKLGTATDTLGDCNIFIDDTSGITISEIMSKCRRLKIERGLDLVMIDYLQLISSGGRKESRQQEISEMTRMLKVMAMDVGVPILLLSQLSRATEQTKDKKPLLSHLRESGSIEQDADVVMLLYRESYYQETDTDIDPDKITNVAEVNIAKHRSGPTGVVKLTWDGALVKFRDLDTYHDAPM